MAWVEGGNGQGLGGGYGLDGCFVCTANADACSESKLVHCAPPICMHKALNLGHSEWVSGETRTSTSGPVQV